MSVDAYSTHIGPLAWAVMMAPGDSELVEMGGGWYSTPLLHGIAEATGQEVFTVESDQWFSDALADYWPAPWHHYITDPEYAIPVSNAGLVFIDAGTIHRAPIVLAARDSGAELVVVHDIEPGGDYPGMWDALDSFKYRRDFTVYREHTAVVSDFVDVNQPPRGY